MMKNRTIHLERGQVLPLMALLLVAFIGLLALAIDLGRLYVARAELSRAVDSAALAGVVELPDQSTAEARATELLSTNLPEASAQFPAPDNSGELRVRGERTVDMLFMGVFGIGDVDISVTASAGSGAKEREIIFVLDDTGTMNNGCNGSQSNRDCPIKQAKDAAHAFIDQIAGGDVKVGVIPFRGCYGDQRYDPYGGRNPLNGCALFSDFEYPTTNATDLHRAIDRLTAAGGSGTNVCSGLNEALQMFLTSDNPNAEKVVVVLTDGDNRYAQGAQSSQRGNPPPSVYPPPANGGAGECMANGYPQDSRSYGNDYDDRVDALDRLTFEKAEELRAQGVEIYVAGYSLTGGPPDGNTCDFGIITSVGAGSRRESGSDRNDRNLARCVASSTAGTNDHYFEALQPADIPQIFSEILQSISFRLVE